MTLEITRIAAPKADHPHFARRIAHRAPWARRSQTLPSETSLKTLVNRRVLCIMDDDNLRIGLRAIGFALSYRTLRTRLAELTSVLDSWVVLSAADGAVARGRYLEQRDWQAVQVPRQVVLHRGVPTVKGNVDHELAFLTGRLSMASPFDVVLLGTGDGDLAVSVARCLREYTSAEVVTLSVPGCSSDRLSDVGLFAGRLLVGRDLVVNRAAPGRRAIVRSVSASTAVTIATADHSVDRGV